MKTLPIRGHKLVYDTKKDDIIYIETFKATYTDYVNCGASNNNLN